MKKILNILAKDHDKWLRIVKSFGLDKNAEDLVQDMYLKIYNLDPKYKQTIMFNDTEVNHYFIFRMLRNMFLDKCKKKKYTTSIETTIVHPISKEISYEYQEQIDLIKNEINTWHVYYKRIHELLYLEGINMTQLSKMTGIDYNVIRRAKQKIDKLLKMQMQ